MIERRQYTAEFKREAAKGMAPCGGKGPAFAGVVGTRAEFHTIISEGAPGTVEGAPGEGTVSGGADEIGEFGGRSGLGEEVKEPSSAEVHPGRPGGVIVPGLVEGGVAEGRHWRVL